MNVRLPSTFSKYLSPFRTMKRSSSTDSKAIPKPAKRSPQQGRSGLREVLSALPSRSPAFNRTATWSITRAGIVLANRRLSQSVIPTASRASDFTSTAVMSVSSNSVACNGRQPDRPRSILFSFLVPCALPFSAVNRSSTKRVAPNKTLKADSNLLERSLQTQAPFQLRLRRTGLAAYRRR